MLELVKELKVVYTHGGIFHADDVFSSALLKLVNSNIEIKRVFKVPEDAFCFDIGYGRYDHHQPNAEVRENGIKYAAFGLLWREIGPELVGEKDAQSFDEQFVQVIDNTDNTGEGNLLSCSISALNPTWDSNEKADDAFDRAVELAKTILESKIESIRSKQRAKDGVTSALEKSSNGVVVLERFMPWNSVLTPDEKALFVVFPSIRGGWNLQVVPKELGNQEPKMPLPNEWHNVAPEGMTFFHNANFLATFSDKEAAVAAAMSVVQH